jgi:hypothetical protein
MWNLDLKTTAKKEHKDYLVRSKQQEVGSRKERLRWEEYY